MVSYDDDFKGLPKEFCDSHLSMDCEKWEMVLVDEKGIEYDTIYIPKRTGLSGGWKAFALDHKLDDGDAVVLELTEPARFKVGSSISHLLLLVVLFLRYLFVFRFMDYVITN